MTDSERRKLPTFQLGRERKTTKEGASVELGARTLDILIISASLESLVGIPQPDIGIYGFCAGT
jgi:hypothetical protein